MVSSALVAACAPTSVGLDAAPSRKITEEPQHVVLIVVDELSASALSPERTPNLVQMGTDGIAFDARSEASECLPSVASLVTSLAPGRLGLDDENGGSILPPGVWTLPEVLRCNGFTTALFAANGFISARYGFDQGFSVHENAIAEPAPRRAADLVRRAVERMSEHDDERTFVYVHLNDPFTYDPPAPFAPTAEDGALRRPDVLHWMWELGLNGQRASAVERRWVERLYDGAVRYVDFAIGGMLDTLRQRALLDHTLLIVTADHGQRLDAHSAFAPRDRAPNDPLRVPLIWRGKGIAAHFGAGAQSTVQLRDVAPTLLEVLDIEIPSRLEGRSFARRGLAAPPSTPVRYPRVRPYMARELCEQLRALGYGDTDCSRLPTAEQWKLAALAAQTPLSLEPCINVR